MSTGTQAHNGVGGYIDQPATTGSSVTTPPDIDPALRQRIPRVHLNQRLGIETEHAADVFGHGRTFFHIENIDSLHNAIRGLIKVAGLYRRGQRNACDIELRHNEVAITDLPPAFEGFRVLQLSDLHLDMNPAFPAALNRRLDQAEYDICVLTGDFRAQTYGPYDAALKALAEVRPHITTPVYGILGNHDSIRMVPAIEALDIRLLLNESVTIRRDGQDLYLAGIDDPHYFRCENFEKAAGAIPADAASILLSHSPETYRRAAHTGFDLMLAGHTHGGQICLPGGLPLMTNADCPRRFCRGAWRFGPMQGYTSVGSGSSVVDVRFNCRPEITVHVLRCQ